MAGKTICLNMIVKNEAPIIRRCLESVRPFIDCWAIVDTGSTDGTQDIVRAFLRGMPGELYERPWRDFAHNRTEALELARGKADYTLIIDADDTLEAAPGATLPALTADAYVLDIADTASTYSRTQLVRGALPWRYEGVVHEYITCGGAVSREKLAGVRMRRNYDGARRRDPQAYRRDAAVLEAALQTETKPFLQARYRFYLAQSYRDCGEQEKALENYLVRAGLGFWQQEVFMSLLYAARLKEELGHPDGEVIAAYEAAANAGPGNAEALHAASRFCRGKRLHERGYRFAAKGLTIPYPRNALFVLDWVYEYGLLDEFALNAYWTGRHAVCAEACDRLLSEGKLPANERERVLGNKTLAEDKRKEIAARPSEAGAYLTLLHAARQKEQLGGPAGEVVSAYMEAAAGSPARAEAWHGAARFCRGKGLHERGYELATKGLAIPYPEGAQGAEAWIYDYGLLDEFAVAAYWAGRYSECVEACGRLLSEGKLPARHAGRILKNLQFAVDKLRELNAAKPGIPGHALAFGQDGAVDGRLEREAPEPADWLMRDYVTFRAYIFE